MIGWFLMIYNDSYSIFSENRFVHVFAPHFQPKREETVGWQSHGHFLLSQNVFAFLMCFSDHFHHFWGEIIRALAFCVAYSTSGNGFGHLRERAGALGERVL